MTPKPRRRPDRQRCEVCRAPAPVWPAGWLRTDDGRDYCPAHAGDRRFIDRRTVICDQED